MHLQVAHKPVYDSIIPKFVPSFIILDAQEYDLYSVFATAAIQNKKVDFL